MTKFIALVSGKGGVGKTTTAVNLGRALADQGREVVMVDANLATPNLGIHLGIVNPENTLNQFLQKKRSIQEVIQNHEDGFSFIPASPSYTEFQKTNPLKLVEVFEHLDNSAEIVLLDGPSGLGVEVEHLLKHSDEALIVVNPTLSSVMDALKTIALAKEKETIIAGILLNMAHRKGLKPEEVSAILGQPILGTISIDHKIRKAMVKGKPVRSVYRWSKIGREMKKVASYLCHEPSD